MKHNSALYEPCDHDGPCTAENKCGCVLRKGFCEKFCACAKGKRCHNRFTGCRCAGGKVRRRRLSVSLSLPFLLPLSF
jgi:histone-lysine N-methyltransferase EZH2